MVAGFCVATGCAVAGCGRSQHNSSSRAHSSASAPDACALVLVPHEGDGKLDQEITRLQAQVRKARELNLWLERLGWAFIAKARESFDPGYYKLAEQCALCIASREPASQEAMLLRGHVLHNLHRFKAAEPLARELVAKRGLPIDFGLLGDVLMEQGKLNEAAQACQAMLDAKPSLHSYARAAHLRWLRGDLIGAIDAMQLAVAAASPLDSESAAWVNTRLASYEFQAGNRNAARQITERALSFQNDYAPALLLRGRMELSEGNAAEAIGPLRRAAELDPLPEYFWVLAEALRLAGRAKDAVDVEKLLNQTGPLDDPRTYSLYLATRGESPETAVQLAENELQTREDVFTHDALAWSLAASGHLKDALPQLKQALAEGTREARLFFHAAVIYTRSGNTREAARFFPQAFELAPLLLPSEREHLRLIPASADKQFTGPTLAGYKQEMTLRHEIVVHNSQSAANERIKRE